MPVLGVCLGHQALATPSAAAWTRAGADARQDVAASRTTARDLFAGLREPFEAGRYHSLVIARDAVPAGLRRDGLDRATTTIMGVRHATWPVFGVQFHPESVLTAVGHRILQNFLEMR